MKVTKKRIIGGALAFAAAFMLSVAAFAQHGPGGPGGHRGPGGHGRHGGPGGGNLLGHISRVLDLTDAQKAQIKQLEDGFKASTKSLREQVAKTGGGPFEALSGGTFDEAAVRAAAQARANVHVELEVAHARFFSQVYAVLTAEQKAKLAELHKQMQERHRQGPPTPGAEDDGK